MQSLQTIKRRIKSVKNIGQITKAMELVSATKMRRSQEVALMSRPYAFAALEMLSRVSEAAAGYTPALLEKRPIATTAVVVIASDKGLTGSFNNAIFRAFEKYNFGSQTLANFRRSGLRNMQYIAVGQKVVSYLERRVGKVERVFTRVGDYTTVEEVRPLAEYIINGYRDKRWDRVVVLYTNFTSVLSQEVVVRELFPVDVSAIRKTADEIIPRTGRFAESFAEQGISFFSKGAMERMGGREYIIEPSPRAVLDELVPHLVLMQLYHIVLEANASEHAARRLAMKSASDNARDITDNLTIEYNKSRQAGITRELIEITAGAEAIQQ